MRVFFLVLLLILNVYAEAKSSGTAQSGKSKKKAKTTVVAKEKKSAQKSNAKSSSKRSSSKRKSSSKTSSAASAVAGRDSSDFVVADSRNIAGDGDSSQIADSLVTDSLKNVVVVRDTVVDTVYVVYKDSAAVQNKSPDCNVPLPRQSAYLGKGFSVGLGGGLFNASKDCDCLVVWQALVDYHYNEYVSSGFDIRFFGGTLDSDVMLMYQRYRLNLRFHKGYPGADFYFAPLLGLETTDLSEFRKELRHGVHKDSPSEEMDPSASEQSNHELEAPEKNCEKMFSLDGFTLGAEAGMGIVVFRYLGLVGSATYEFNFSWTQLATFSPGIAFNLHEVWPWANKNLRSTWISFEMVFQRYFNRGVKEWSVAGFVGFQFGI